MNDPFPCDSPLLYEIRVQGVLDSRWSAWFDGLAVTPQPDGETALSGPVIDQAALYGLLNRLRDLGLTLLSVNRVVGERKGGNENERHRPAAP